MRTYVSAITVLLLLVGFLPGQLKAQQQEESLERNAVMRAADLLEDDYVIPETAHALATMLRHRASEFAGYTDRTEFAASVTEAMREIANDKHLRIFPNRDTLGMPIVRRQAAPGDRGGTANRVVRRAPEPDSADTAGPVFARPTIEARMLSDEVGYVRVSFLYLDAAAKQTLQAAMESIQESKVVVLDMRGVPGGVEDAVMHLSGYFFAESTHLVTTQRRGESEIQRWSDPSVRGPKFVDEPLFILTSAYTGSAAESFVLGMKATGRATTVGEQTAGAGHFGTIADLGGGYQMFLPFGRTFNPRTGIGFEATGIQPDIAAPAAEALSAALRKAGYPVPETTPEPSRPADLTLDDYVGQYGPRSITLPQSTLRYQRAGMPRSVAMKPVGLDEFELVIPPGAVVRGATPGAYPTIRFNRGPSGSVESLSIVNPDGSVRDTSVRE